MDKSYQVARDRFVLNGTEYQRGDRLARELRHAPAQLLAQWLARGYLKETATARPAAAVKPPTPKAITKPVWTKPTEPQEGGVSR